MKSIIWISLLIFLASSGLVSGKTHPELESDWPCWRGPTLNNKATGMEPPMEWNAKKNVQWKTKLQGYGHASPIVSGELVILATADVEKETQALQAHSREDGHLLWLTVLHKGKFAERIHKKNTHASQTPASNGKMVFISFQNDKKIKLSALNLSGKVIWQKSMDFDPQKRQFGYAPSPLLYKNLVIISAECDTSSEIRAHDQKTGDLVWKTKRPLNLSWSSPIIGHVASKDQLLLSGAGRVSSYDPLNGKEMWSVAGSAQATAGTMVWNDSMVFASGGHPEKETLAIACAKETKIVWKNKVKCYEPSMLLHDGYLYAATDRGLLYCFRSTDGREMWSTRIGRAVSASPLLYGNQIYLSNGSGETIVFEANPKKYRQLAINKLGDETLSTPAISAGQLFLRTGFKSGRKTEQWLYCLSEKK